MNLKTDRAKSLVFRSRDDLARCLTWAEGLTH